MKKLTTEEKLDIYERIMLVVAIIVIGMALLSSCTTSKPASYQNHLKTTHHNNWIKRDNGGCAWSN